MVFLYSSTSIILLLTLYYPLSNLKNFNSTTLSHQFTGLEIVVPNYNLSIIPNISHNKPDYTKPPDGANIAKAKVLELYEDNTSGIDFWGMYSMRIVPTPLGSSGTNKSVDTPVVPVLGLLAVGIYLIDLLMM